MIIEGSFPIFATKIHFFFETTNNRGRFSWNPFRFFKKNKNAKMRISRVSECRVELVPTLQRRVGCLWSVASWNLPTQITQIVNCKLWPTSQSTRKTWHPNPHLAPLVEGCSVSAWYLIWGWASSPILIIRHLAFTKSARLYVFQNPKSWQNSYLLAISRSCAP